MILPRPTPLTSLSTMSKASISGWASRKDRASSTEEPDGETFTGNQGARWLTNAALLSCREALGNIAEGGDEAVDLRLLGRRRHQHHVVDGRDQHAAIDQRDVDRSLERRRVRWLRLGAVPGRGR